MQYKKNKLIIFFIANFVFLLFIFGSIFFTYKFLINKNLHENKSEFVKGGIIINPEKKSPEIINRKIKIKLLAKTDDNLNWEFKPLVNEIEVKIGENNTIKYHGKNLSEQTITSTANFVIEPEAVQAYLIKTECFCFIEQTLKPGETQIFTMVFYIDPNIDSDWYFNDLKELVFTYEFSEYKS